ncbi:MAG: FAD-dependent oxidoreductase, partial [Elusimicrobia bacterium]|nr:FAD-dependent oxidoreductase [Elusimicrobiota bacterium]
MKNKDERKRNEGYLMTDKQMREEMLRCIYCEDKPCMEACPVDCSPADFIMAARNMTDADMRRATAIIMKDNPFGGICGMVCPDRHCMDACSRKLFDGPINIPDLQAEIVQRGKEAGGIPEFNISERYGMKVAVVGGGPAGYGAASFLAQKGYTVDIFEAREETGGMCNLIPDYRLDREVLKTDMEFAESLGGISVKRNSKIEDVAALKADYDAVIVATGLWTPIYPGAENEEAAIDSIAYLSDPKSFSLKGRVGVVGGGATALDCAVTAKRNGASGVELFALENISELPLSVKEREELLEYGIDVSGRTKVVSVKASNNEITGIKTVKVKLAPGKEFSLAAISDVEGSEQERSDIEHLIIAVGNRAENPVVSGEGIFSAGDCVEGPTTVVEAVAAGKNAALKVDAYVMKTASPEIEVETKNRVPLPGYV